MQIISTFQKNIFYGFILLFSFVFGAAQHSLSGKISDAGTKKPVSGVQIFVNNQKTAMLTTKSDVFSLVSDTIIYQLTFKKDNYTTAEIAITDKTTPFLEVSLIKNAEKEKAIEGVVIKTTAVKYKTKKENPAYAIMREVWKRKRNNGLDNFKNYQYDEYEKIEFDLSNIDSAFMKKKVFNKVNFIFKYADSADNGKLALPVFLNEAVYKNFGRNEPNKKTVRELVANKTSGFQNNEIMSLTVKNLYKDLNIYDNTLNYFNIGFPSPVATDGFSTYDYNLIDTLKVKGESCFHIKYFPKRTDVLAFRGDLYISTEKYAVVRAVLHSVKKINVNFVNGFSTELEYDTPDENTFLISRNDTQLDLSLISKMKNAKGMIAKRSVLYHHYLFDQKIDDTIFDEKKDPDESEAYKKDDGFWETARVDSLSTSERGVYKMLDELQKVPKFNRIVKFYETLSSGFYNIGHGIDIGNLYNTFGFNDVEGTRLRMGARTYFSTNDLWRVQGYGAYGFKDHQFKYGAEAKYMFNKYNRFMIGAGTRRDVMQLGAQLTGDDGIMSRSFASSTIFASGSNTSLSSVNQTNVFTAIDPWKNFQVRLDGTLQSISSANPEKFNLNFLDENGQIKQQLNDTHITLSLIAKPGAKFSQYGIDRYQHTSLAPTFVLKYTRGLKGLLGADFSYDKLQFLYKQPILLSTWGKILINLEAGKNLDAVPLALQNIIPGNQSYALIPNTFSLMNYYEFVADSYATVQLEHHFNGKILSYIPLIKKLKFRELAFFRGAYGTLSNESKNLILGNKTYVAPDQQIYYEYGFGIENIGFGNLRILRIDFNWRGNYLDHPDVNKFGIKAGFQFTF